MMVDQNEWPGCSNDSDFKQHLMDQTRLRERALEEFSRALRTGRLIAFTGSMVTQELGYPDWPELLRTPLSSYFEENRDPKSALSGYLEAAARDVNAKSSSSLTSYDFLLNHQRFSTPAPGVERARWSEVQNEIQKKFLPRSTPAKFYQKETTVERIVQRLGIRRILTLNYDIESELALLSSMSESMNNSGDMRWRKIREMWSASAGSIDIDSHDFLKADSSFRRTVHTPDGEWMISDSFARERTDRLFEFAIGASDIDGHVMHLHGRVDRPESMIISYNDYERLYRKSSLTKLPFEHAMRSLYAGNPIVFIGLGMSEDEVLFHLKQFVSDGSPHHLAPHFVIWSPNDASRNEIEPLERAHDKSTGKFNRAPNSVFQDDELRRLRWYRQYGIYTIFDNELPGYSQLLDIGDDGDDRLRRSIYLLSSAATKAMEPFSWSAAHFRSMRNFLGGPTKVDPEGIPISGAQLWSAEDNYNPFFPDWKIDDDPSDPGPGASDIEDYLRHIIDHGAPIKAWLDAPGSGHGYIARLIRKLVTDRQASRNGTSRHRQSPCIYAQINAGFAWEFDSSFELISGLYDGEVAFENQNSRAASFESFLRQLRFDLEDAATSGKVAQGHRRIVVVINGADRLFDADGYPLSADLDNLLRLLPNVYGELDSIRDAGDGYANPFNLFLFGTNRVARYLDNLGLLSSDKSVNSPFVDFYGTLQKPYHGESSRRMRPNGSASGMKFLDSTVIDWLDNEFTKLPSSIKLSRWADFPLITEGHPLVTSRTEDFDGGTLVNPSGTQQFRSAYLRAAEAAMRKNIRINNPSYRISKTHRTLLNEFRLRGPHRQRRAFFDAYLNPQTLSKSFPPDKWAADRAVLGLYILQTLAFVGQPIELSTLLICPEVSRHMFTANVANAVGLKKLLDELCDRQLICRIGRFPGNTSTTRSVLDPDTGERFGLHRALLHEIRDRYTVPLSDARTYTSFNIPLYAAQPIDDSEPERRVYADLQALTHRLITITSVDKINGWESYQYRYGMRLVAAAASMRSYYTTSALLMHEPEPAPSDRPSTLLTDHARLLEELISAFEINARERASFLASKSRAVNRAMCVFPDQLVWLHDQRGVALLAQGNLYEARYALRQARSINAQFIERDGDRESFGQNWRRITLNEVHLDIERGKLVSAEGKLRALEQSVNWLCQSVGWEESHRRANNNIGRRVKVASSAFATIIQKFAASDVDMPRMVDPAFPTDAILIAGLICGYRGWCAFLAGEFKNADKLIGDSVRLLKNLREQRAYAHFLRLLATVQNVMGHTVQGRESLRLCLAAAEAGRQLDISYLARINRAELDLSNDGGNQHGRILQELHMALRYATLTDMFRVRMEARRALAVYRMNGGDYDGALEHASDALAIAMRFGFALRKISMRTMIGEILILRGDSVSGFSMLDQSMREADRAGYQRAVERVHAVRMRYEHD